MPEECKYYYWDHGYSCAIKRERAGNSSVDSDIVHRYCWGYHYEECPTYRSEQSSGGCFLTSACVEAKGLPDDCEELTVLRGFRDSWLKKQPNGMAEIMEYYHIAPAIVAAIHELPNTQEIFNKIYEDLIVPCVHFIHGGENEKAYSLYRAYVRELQTIYL